MYRFCVHANIAKIDIAAYMSLGVLSCFETVYISVDYVYLHVM